MSDDINYWTKLTSEQLQGAKYSLQLLRTSVIIRGEALKLLDSLISNITQEQDGRK
jgi:hypothetical protein